MMGPTKGKSRKARIKLVKRSWMDIVLAEDKTNTEIIFNVEQNSPTHAMK